MDHWNLEYFMMTKKLNQKQACWFLYLTRFNFILYYYTDKSIDKLDILSHRLDHGNESYDNKDVVLPKLKFLAACQK